MPIRHGKATWPGAIGVEACTYTASHGISPGIAQIKVQPQAQFIAETGDLIITDDVGTVRIVDCKVDSMIQEFSAAGWVWSIILFDRRWKWAFGTISGTYNQLDKRQKLYPDKIRSPHELAVLCLEEMGERNYEIDLPEGLSRTDGERFRQVQPDPNINVVPTTGTNPPVNWENEIPAQALANLCEQYGRRVVFDPVRNRVIIARQGVGANLPDNFSIAQETPTFDLPERPDGIAVRGQPTKVQARFLCDEPVGQEWNGHWLPINELSYAPRFEAATQQHTLTFTADSEPTIIYVYLNAPENGLPSEGVLFQDSTAIDIATAVAAIADEINNSADPRVQGIITASASGGTLTVTGLVDGQAFAVYAAHEGDGARVNIQLVRVAHVAGASWEYSRPPYFEGVRAVAGRLTIEEARGLAQQFIFKAYRLTMLAPDGSGSPLQIPGYTGDLTTRFQITLLDTKCEQVTPQPLDPQLVNPQTAGVGTPQAGQLPANVATLNFYNGYSRDMPATMHGGHSRQIALNQGFVFHTANTAENTARTAQIFVPFSIIPEEHIVLFTSPVYRTTSNRRILPCERPVLETGCYIRNLETWAYETAIFDRLLPGARDNSLWAVRTYPDIQVFMIAQYIDDNVVSGNLSSGARILEDDAQDRARYYLDGLELQYLLEGALTREYNGIVPINLDGSIGQVTWEVGPAGAGTTASKNTEHSIYVPPYRARRRVEFLSPPRVAQMQADQLNRGAGNFARPFAPQ